MKETLTLCLGPEHPAGVPDLYAPYKGDTGNRCPTCSRLEQMAIYDAEQKKTAQRKKKIEDDRVDNEDPAVNFQCLGCGYTARERRSEAYAHICPKGAEAPKKRGWKLW